MMEIRLKSAYLELLLLCLCLGKILGQGSGEPVRVNVGSDAVLPCSIRPEKNIEGDLFDWKKVGQKEKEVFKYDAGLHYNNGLPGQDEQFKDRVSYFSDQLQSGNASIKISDTKLSDSGTYTCDFPRLQPNRQTFNIDLVVDCVLKDRSEENIPGPEQPESSTGWIFVGVIAALLVVAVIFAVCYRMKYKRIKKRFTEGDREREMEILESFRQPDPKHVINS